MGIPPCPRNPVLRGRGAWRERRASSPQGRQIVETPPEPVRPPRANPAASFPPPGQSLREPPWTTGTDGHGGARPGLAGQQARSWAGTRLQPGRCAVSRVVSGAVGGLQSLPWEGRLQWCVGRVPDGGLQTCVHCRDGTGQPQRVTRSPRLGRLRTARRQCPAKQNAHRAPDPEHGPAEGGRQGDSKEPPSDQTPNRLAGEWGAGRQAADEPLGQGAGRARRTDGRRNVAGAAADHEHGSRTQRGRKGEPVARTNPPTCVHLLGGPGA